MSTVQERVDAGVVWLNENSPDWLDTVVVKRLEMDNPCACVLGQVFADKAEVEGDDEGLYYCDGYDYATSTIITNKQGQELGFDAVGYLDLPDEAIDEDFKKLQRAWTKKIRELRRIRRINREAQ